MITLPASITGGAQTGFTTPGYSTTADKAVDTNVVQAAVTGLTGTQVGVTAHSVSSPFTVSASRPKQFAVLGKPNPVTGLIGDVPNNNYKVLTRKGVTPAVNQPIKPLSIESNIRVPAGADTYDAANIRAAISAHIGLLTSISAGLGDTVINGVL